jgi:hypothetical protein
VASIMHGSHARAVAPLTHTDCFLHLPLSSNTLCRLGRPIRPTRQTPYLPTWSAVMLAARASLYTDAWMRPLALQHSRVCIHDVAHMSCHPVWQDSCTVDTIIIGTWVCLWLRPSS